MPDTQDDDTIELSDPVTEARRLLALQDERDAEEIPDGYWKALGEFVR